MSNCVVFTGKTGHYPLCLYEQQYQFIINRAIEILAVCDELK